MVLIHVYRSNTCGWCNSKHPPPIKKQNKQTNRKFCSKQYMQGLTLNHRLSYTHSQIECIPFGCREPGASQWSQTRNPSPGWPVFPGILRKILQGQCWDCCHVPWRCCRDAKFGIAACNLHLRVVNIFHQRAVCNSWTVVPLLKDTLKTEDHVSREEAYTFNSRKCHRCIVCALSLKDPYLMWAALFGRKDIAIRRVQLYPLDCMGVRHQCLWHADYWFTTGLPGGIYSRTVCYVVLDPAYPAIYVLLMG